MVPAVRLRKAARPSELPQLSEWQIRLPLEGAHRTADVLESPRLASAGPEAFPIQFRGGIPQAVARLSALHHQPQDPALALVSRQGPFIGSQAVAVRDGARTFTPPAFCGSARHWCVPRWLLAPIGQ